MADTLISLQEAAELSGKSVQTIRRAIKARKLTSKRKKTPQGFNYLISRESVVQAYKLRIAPMERQAGGISGKKRKNADLAAGYATMDDLKKMQGDIENLLSEHEKAKESFMRFMKAFQERFVVLENQLKLLEAPDKKRWFQFWK